MSVPHLIVLGAGAAGTAAAWQAARAGAEVTVVDHLPGATELYSGALDLDVPSDPGAPALEADLQAFVRAIGIWSVEPRPCRIATGAGVVRRVRGLDSALLDLEPLSGLKVAVADVERQGYDGKLLARALEESDWARSTGTRFEPVKVNILRREQERRYPSCDFASLHDAPERIEWLAEQLGRAAPGHDGWLVGPWLGLDPEAAAHLRLALLRPVGETTSLPGESAGARFRRARDRLLERLGVNRQRARVVRIEHDGRGWVVSLAESGPGFRRSATRSLWSPSVVIATGGLVSGGIELAPAGTRGPPFRLAFWAPVELTIEGPPLLPVSSLHGPTLDRFAPGVLEKVGLLVHGGRVPAEPGLFAAGAVVAGRPRTVLEAAGSGIAAARAALVTSNRPPPSAR